MSESTQHVLTRVRPPRVKITYDVEIGDAIEKKELPFIIGIMADLSGKPVEPLPPVKDRKFVEIDRDNINDVLTAMAPHVALRVPNRLSAEGNEQLSVTLDFKHMDDFGPEEVVRQVPALARLFQARQMLRDLLAKLDGNEDLEVVLRDILTSAEHQAELRALVAPAAEAAAPETPPA